MIGVWHPSPAQKSLQLKRAISFSIGMLQWAPKLPEMIVGAGLTHQEVLCKMLLGNILHPSA